MAGRKRVEHRAPTRKEQRIAEQKLRHWRMTCSSRKVSYETENEARSQVAAMGKTAMSVYRCPECKLWHATKNRGGTCSPATKEGRV